MTVNTMIRLSCIFFVAVIAIFKNFITLDAVANKEFLAVTVATTDNDALERYKLSAESYNISFEIFGLGEVWQGGDIANKPGGGQKVRILQAGLKKYKDEADMIIMFTDSYDVVFQNNSDYIVKSFKESGAKVLFSAEGFCWPDSSLMNLYPEVSRNEKRFLNSGGFIGYAPYVYKIVAHDTIENDDDDQLYYTNIFLNETLRNEYEIQLDTKSEVFQNLNGALGEVLLIFNGNQGMLKNVLTDAFPAVIHANGPIKNQFNMLTNYLGFSWTPSDGCQQCKVNRIDLSSKQLNDYPKVTVALVINTLTPFFDEYLEKIEKLSYPKEKLDIIVYCLTEFHLKQCRSFVYRNINVYSSVKLNTEMFITEFSARNDIVTKAIEMNNDFLFVIDSIVQLTNKQIIEHLISQNRSILAPLIPRREGLWSNFWGALNRDGFYARSEDYMEIVQSVKQGIWNVPFVNLVYLIRKDTVLKLQSAFGDESSSFDVDMEFCSTVRNKNIFMYIDNQNVYGHQVVADNVTTSHLHNDLWQLFSNPQDWEEKYINSKYYDYASDERIMQDIPQPCPDVFWFPFVSETFCKQMIEEMENFGQWSDGSNYDSRLEGGYENVPTRDIHMRQVDWEGHWMHILKEYIYPMQKKLFDGYMDVPWARMNFVVRYRPDEQPTLRPHHDASSYSLNVALNLPGIDFQGGGTRFNRYNCEVRQSKLGWVLMHPGRVTHLHEGLRTTNGTRYIFVTFVNP